MDKIHAIYTLLMKHYGPQGWWPLLSVDGINPTKTGSIKGYHPGDYSYPKDDNQRFEICLGAILTQNTSWSNVEKALLKLNRIKAIDPVAIAKLSDGKLRELIRPSGYYNQKAKKVRAFLNFYEGLGGRTPDRDELLALTGIGPETADSILLYAYHVPSFIVDSYTRKIFFKLGLVKSKQDYDSIKAMFEKSLAKDFRIYQEYHALIVEHAKRYYVKRGASDDCFLFKEFGRERKERS